MKLENGNIVKAGTVATTLHCIDMYNKGDRSISIIDKINESIPILINAGLFDLFTPNEWINCENQGRKYVGLKAKEYLEKIKK